MPNLAYLSLGSNVGDREHQLRDAIARLETAGRIVSVSSFYETEPVEFADQSWFLNCAVALETGAAAEHLMTALLEIEQQMGRQRVQKKGPRTIDLDILLFTNPTSGDAVIDSPALTIPPSRDAPAPLRAAAAGGNRPRGAASGSEENHSRTAR